MPNPLQLFARLRLNALKFQGWAYRARTAMGRRFGQGKRVEQERSDFYETTWRRAADQHQATVVDRGAGLLEIAGEQGATRVHRNYTPLDDPVTLRLAGDKPAVLRRLHDHQIPTPAWRTFSLKDMEPAKAFLKGRTCVVKPARYTGAGSGVTTGVQTLSQLQTAASLAGAFDQLLLIEEQCRGENYRLLFLDGRLLETVQRNPPSVLGDGRMSIKQLIGEENRLRVEQGWRRAQTLLVLDTDVRRTLALNALSLSYRPQANETIAVKTVINENRAAENAPVQTVSADVVRQCRLAAESVGARLAGVDVVANNLRVPLAESGGVVLEVNTTPGLYHHYDPEQDLCRVAASILRACFTESARRSELCSPVLEHAD